MKTSSLHFLCWLKENEAKERAFRGGGKNPVHHARQLAERRNPLRSHRSAPLPCYGKRIFSVTPQVGEMTYSNREIQRIQLWQDATVSSEVPPCNLLFSFLCFVSFFFSGRRKKERNEGKKAYYGYNASNTRTYKISMLNANTWVNGQPEPLSLQLQQAMFYPNAYLNFNHNGEYTKHYYNGSERIASRLGDAQPESFVISSNDRLGFRTMQADEQSSAELLELVFAGDVPIETPSVDVTTLQVSGNPDDIFYYHTNHLGSTAFITDNNTNIHQGFLYAPFGEITTEYDINFGYNVLPKYSFNAKELDEETGMYYYEARYYKPPVFTSRDPMFEKYFWTNPYGYCNNNPIKYIDPTGKDGVVIVDDETQTLTIKATYFVLTEGRKGTYYTSKGIKLMNEEINNFLNSNEYSVTEGQYKGYSVKFDLQFKEGGASYDAESLSKQENYFGIPIRNSISKGGRVLYPQFFTPNIRGEVYGGVTDNNNKTIIMNSSFDNLHNRIHEIFHTLFFDNDNASDGIGSYEHVEMPNQNDINMLINNDSLPKYKP